MKEKEQSRPKRKGAAFDNGQQECFLLNDFYLSPGLEGNL